MTDIIRNETAHSINGVLGRLLTLRRPPTPWKAGTFANQRWVSESRDVNGYGAGALMHVEVRFDDTHKNGKNDFAITAEIVKIVRGSRRPVACGCLHDEICEAFPELSPLIKWHLVSAEGPLHYLKNVTYLAGDRDFRGRAPGEVSRFETFAYFGDCIVPHVIGDKWVRFISERMTEIDTGVFVAREAEGAFRTVAIAYDGKHDGYKFKPKYSLVGFADRWHECPFGSEYEAQAWATALNTGPVRIVRVPVEFSEGKPRELAAARRAAVWPEATDDELTVSTAALTAKLKARLPALLTQFRADIEAAGFLWECPAE